MHEMALCESLLRAIEESAVVEGFTRVRRVRLEIGRLAAVEPDALRFGFEVVMRGSLAEGADLVLLDRPGQGWCFDCCDTVAIDDRLSPCPRCGGARVQASGGTEMTVKDLEVE